MEEGICILNVYECNVHGIMVMKVIKDDYLMNHECIVPVNMQIYPKAIIMICSVKLDRKQSEFCKTFPRLFISLFLSYKYKW